MPEGYYTIEVYVQGNLVEKYNDINKARIRVSFNCNKLGMLK